MLNRSWLTAVYRRLTTRTVRPRPRGRRTNYSSVPAMVETLEPRVLLSWLTVIVHGQTESACTDWVTGTESVVGGTTDAQLLGKLTLETDYANVDEGDPLALSLRLKSLAQPFVDTINASGGGRDAVLRVDWPDARAVPGDWADFLSRPGIADDIGVQLGLVIGTITQKTDIDRVHLIGFSRGSYVVSAAAAVLGRFDFDQSLRNDLEDSTEAAMDYYLNPAASGIDFQMPRQVNMTTLDPQAFGIDINDDDGDGVVKRWGVRRWENYYQYLPGDLNVSGKSLSDADVNKNITAIIQDKNENWLLWSNFHNAVRNWYRDAVAIRYGLRQFAETWTDDTEWTGYTGLRWTDGISYLRGRPVHGQPREVVPVSEMPMLEQIEEGSQKGNESNFEPPPGSGSSTTTIPVNGAGNGSKVGTTPVGQVAAYAITATRSGNLVIDVSGLVGAAQTTVVLKNRDGATVDTGSAGSGLGTNARVSVVNVRVGDRFTLFVFGPGTVAINYVVTVTQPSESVIDPHGPPPIPVLIVDDAPDRYAEAVQIQLNQQGSASYTRFLDGNYHPNSGDGMDHDWFTITARKDGPMRIAVKNLNAKVRVHGSDSTTLKVDSDPNPAVALLDVRAGQIFRIDVGPNAAGVTGKYTLQISQPSSNVVPAEPPVQNGEVPWLAGVPKAVINLSDGAGQSVGSIDDPADTEWFEIKGPHEGNMVAQVLPVNDDLKPFVTAFRVDGGGIDTDTGEFDGEAKVGFEVSEGERIIVAVTSHAGRYTGGFTLNVSQPGNLPDDDVNDFGEEPRLLGGGSFQAKIETSDDNDWFEIPIHAQGFFSIDVSARDSGLVPFLELSRDGTSGGFFETDDGRDGKAKISFLPESGQNTVWAKVSSVDGTEGGYTLTTWGTQNPNDDYPDSGGTFLSPRELAPRGQLFIPGRIEGPGDSDNFHVRVDQPGPVVVQVISLTEGMTPFFSRARESSDPDQRTGTSGGTSGRGGQAFEMITNMLPADDNWLVIDVKAGGDSTQPFGDYVVHVWQPGSDTDRDADTVGIEASPILLNGSGNGSLPGSPNGNMVTPALDHEGDKDVFQVLAASDRPITFTVSGQDTFITAFDASGHAIQTDHQGVSNGASQITLDAERGQLFYVQVAAYDGQTTGSYQVQVSQPTDDHPDSPIFQRKLGQTLDATAIILNSNGFGQATGEIETDLVGDHDVFQVLVAGRGRMTVNVAGTGDTLDSYVHVYDSRGNLVAIDDDGGDIRNSSVTFNTFQDETYFIEVSGYNDQSVGTYLVQVQAEPPLQQTIVGMYDDFADRQRDDFKWQDYQPVNGFVSESVPGRQDLELFADGNNAPDNNTAATRSLATIQCGVSFYAAVVLGSEVYNRAEIELRNSTDQDPNAGDAIRISLVRQQTNGSVFATVTGQGYEQLTNVGPQQYPESAGFLWTIREASDGTSIEVVLNSSVVATFQGSIKPDSHLWARSVTAGGSGRFARLNIDEVSVQEARLSRIESEAYDNFDDNSLNHEKFHVLGTVEEREGALKLSLFRQGSPMIGYVSTNGHPDGINLRGFKLNANRTTEPKRLSSDDARARMRLTNGVDFIEIEWKFESHIFRINTAGAYGVQHVDIPVPSAEVQDGPLEVRERDGNIEVLHNGQVKLTLLNQTVRAGSFFTFETDGLITGGDPVDNPPQGFDVFIDDLVFYRDPLPNTLQVTPTLTPDSDMGASNTDHVTNQLTLDFDWAAGPAGTKYQCREGKLEDDGSISFGAWSAPQSETTATVNLTGASVHVFSVRPIDAQGLVGQESSRGVQVDVINPTSTDFLAVRDTQLRLEFSMSEPVVATLSNVVVRDSSNQIITPLGLEGSGTTTLAVVLPTSSTVDTYSITLSGATDVAGNLLADAIITPINDPPAIGAFDTTVTYTENGPAMLLDPNATVTDVDKPRFNGDVLMIGVTDNVDEAYDRLEIRPVTRLIGVSESDLTFRGTTIASFTGGAGVSPLIITFNANATESAVQAVLRNVTYRSLSGNPSTLPRTVRVILTDGTGTPSNLPTKTINFAPGTVPLADSLSVTSVAENQPSVTTVSLLGANDSEYSLSFATTPITEMANTDNDQNREYLLSFVSADDSGQLNKRRRRL